MRLFALVLLAALPASAAQTALTGVSLATPLAARLHTALPAMTRLELKVPALDASAGGLQLPSMYRLEKAQALAAALPAAPAAGPAASPEQAQATIAAVNAVLKDFSPEEISNLPAEDVAALSGLLFDQMGVQRPADPEADSRALAVLAKVSAARILEKSGKPMREVLLNPGHNDTHPDDIEVHGVPAGVKPVEADGVVWRHYTTKEGFKAIQESGTLINGFVSYVQVSRGTFKKVFKDVGGLFLTKAGVGGEQVGVPSREYPHYVDVVLPAAMTVLEIEPGKIWLLPLPHRSRGWFAGLYRRWAGGGEADRTYLRGLQDMEAHGGPGPDLAVPVSIVEKGEAK